VLLAYKESVDRMHPDEIRIRGYYFTSTKRIPYRSIRGTGAST
jgi:hypothetical protein